MTLALAGLVACEQSVPYEKGAQMDLNGPNVYFSNYNTPEVVLASDATEFEVALLRSDAKDALTVPLKGVCTIDGIFDVPESVEFPSGVDSVNVKITVLDKIEMFKNYSLTLSVPEEYTHQYALQDGYPACSVEVVKEDYVTYAEGLFYDTFWEETAWAHTLQYSELLGNYRIKNPWGTGGEDFVFTWDGTEKVTMSAKKYATGITHPSYGAITANILGAAYSHFAAGELMETECDAFLLDVEWTVSAGPFGEYPLFFIVTEVLK